MTYLPIDAENRNVACAELADLIADGA